MAGVVQQINVKPRTPGEHGLPKKPVDSATVTRSGVSRACDPCTNLYLLPYVGKSKGPQFLKVMLGRRGWYARVLEEGSVRAGDPIVESSD